MVELNRIKQYGTNDYVRELAGTAAERDAFTTARVGDKWFIVASGVITEEYVWDGSNWLAKAVGDFNTLLSKNGFEVIDDTTLHSGNWVRIVVVADANFTTLTGNSDVTLPKTFLAGEELDGEWTAIQLTSGELRAYKGA